MKIAFAARIHESSTGGVRRVMDALAQELRKKGHSVDIVLHKTPICWSDFLRFPFHILKQAFSSSWDVLITHSSDGFAVALARKIFRKLPVVIMHSHGWEARAFESWEKYAAHYGAAPSLLNRIIARLLRHPLLSWNLRWAEGCVFVSEEDRQWVAARHPRQKGTLAFIPNASNPSVFFSEKGQRANCICVLATYVPRKGNAFLVPILSKIFAECPDAQVDLIGLGLSETERCRVFASLDKTRLCFHENLSPAEIAPLLRKTKIFLHLSLFEGGIPSLALLEAMACGAVPAAFSYDGIGRFLKEGTNALLTEPGDSKSLAVKAVSLLNHPEKWQVLSENCVQDARHYTWDKSAEQWNEKIMIRYDLENVGHRPFYG